MMANELQHGEVSLNIKRGLVHLVSACVDRLKRNGPPTVRSFRYSAAGALPPAR